MERFALSRMKEWKENENRKPLIIRGARQVGKTWIMKTFGQQYFEKTAYVNFDNNARMKQVFEGDLDIERLVLAISAETGVSIEAENTLIIFDEIQEVPKALTSLKYFYENAPQYAIVAAGSLLGVALHQGTSFPVGKVDFLDLYPLNFREFLCAMGEKQFVSMLDSCDTQMVTVFKTKYIERLREYYFVGGMPEVVKDFSEKKDYNRVRAIQKNLINYYQQDFSKHAEIKLVPRLNLVWNSIPMQLAKENKKYIYDNVLKNHETLPLGEFAIGTNTTAYVAAKKFNIEDKMPILIAEKTGPHFAVGDTCYSWSEEIRVYNPNGKEIVAKDNSCSLLRKEDVSKAYFNCHTDITVPYKELEEISVVTNERKDIILLENGRFVLPGTEVLNEPLDEAGF